MVYRSSMNDETSIPHGMSCYITFYFRDAVVILLVCIFRLQRVEIDRQNNNDARFWSVSNFALVQLVLRLPKFFTWEAAGSSAKRELQLCFCGILVLICSH